MALDNPKGIDNLSDSFIRNLSANKTIPTKKIAKQTSLKTIKVANLREIASKGFTSEGTGFYRSADHHLWKVESNGEGFDLVRLAGEDEPSDEESHSLESYEGTSLAASKKNAYDGTCETCEGTGVEDIYGNGQCPNCNGTGKDENILVSTKIAGPSYGGDINQYQQAISGQPIDFGGKVYRFTKRMNYKELSQGKIVGASYKSTNAGAGVYEILGYSGMEEKYGEGGVKYSSIQEVFQEFGVSTLNALDEKTDELAKQQYGKDSYGHGIYMWVKDLEDGEEGGWFYIYGNKWARGSGAEPLTWWEVETEGQDDPLKGMASKKKHLSNILDNKRISFRSSPKQGGLSVHAGEPDWEDIENILDKNKRLVSEVSKKLVKEYGWRKWEADSEVRNIIEDWYRGYNEVPSAKQILQEVLQNTKIHDKEVEQETSKQVEILYLQDQLSGKKLRDPESIMEAVDSDRTDLWVYYREEDLGTNMFGTPRGIASEDFNTMILEGYDSVIIGGQEYTLSDRKEADKVIEDLSGETFKINDEAGHHFELEQIEKTSDSDYDTLEDRYCEDCGDYLFSATDEDWEYENKYCDKCKKPEKKKKKVSSEGKNERIYLSKNKSNEPSNEPDTLTGKWIEFAKKNAGKNIYIVDIKEDQEKITAVLSGELEYLQKFVSYIEGGSFPRVYTNIITNAFLDDISEVIVSFNPGVPFERVNSTLNAMIYYIDKGETYDEQLP